MCCLTLRCSLVGAGAPYLYQAPALLYHIHCRPASRYRSSSQYIEGERKHKTWPGSIFIVFLRQHRAASTFKTNIPLWCGAGYGWIIFYIKMFTP